MKIETSELRQQIIGPTLQYLGINSPVAEELLLGTAILESQLNPLLKSNEALGIYQITPQQHRMIWDKYLAFRPDLASKVRGLASQHRFLEDPDKELSCNLSYATAIAWLMYQRENVPLPSSDNIQAIGKLWSKCFHKNSTEPQQPRRFSGWLTQYRRTAAAA